MAGTARWQAGALAAVLALAGCTDDGGEKVVYPEDSSPPRPDGSVGFLGSCTRDEDCQSGRCAAFGAARRCTRPCSSSSPCPGLKGWKCDPESFCACTPTGRKPDVCNVDGDCDGVADKQVTKETCNDDDDDCNGEVDDVAPGTKGATKYYRDGDGDGYGDEGTIRWLCEAQSGWVTVGGDCDDTRKMDNPSAEEICGDKHDSDCDGTNEDVDVCGLVPPLVPDVEGGYSSGTLKQCGKDGKIAQGLDVTEILAKQDAKALKYTIRVAGAPATSTCSSYTLRLGAPKKGADVVYVYRPAKIACGSLPQLAAYHKGVSFGTSAKVAFNAASPGHVSFVLTKAELYPKLPTPTYALEACTNVKADPVKDRTACDTDSCATPVHR